MSKINKFIKQTSGYLVGNLGVRITGFVSLPILTRMLPLEEYGVLSLISATLLILVALFKFGLQHSAVRFFNDHKENKESQLTFYSTLYWGSLILALLGAILVYTLYKIVHLFYNNLFSQDIIIVLGGLIVSEIMLIRFTNFFQVQQKINMFNLLYIIQSYGGVALGIIFIIYISKTAIMYFSAYLIVGMLIFVCTSLVFLLQGKINPKYFSVSFFKESMHFGIPLQLMEFGNLLIKFSDKYLLQIFVGLAAVGIYSVGANLTRYAQELIFLPITYSIFPLLMEIHKEKGMLAAEQFISKISNYVWMVAIPVVFGFSMLREDIVLLLASEKFAETSQIIPIMIIGTVLWGFCQSYSAGLHLAKKTKTFAIVVFAGAVINILLNVVFIPILSFFGAALATLFTYIMLLFLVIRVSFVHLKININLSKLSEALVASVIMSIIIYFIRVDYLIVQILLKTILGILVYLAIIVAIDSEIRDTLRNMYKKRLVPSLDTSK